MKTTKELLNEVPFDDLELTSFENDILTMIVKHYPFGWNDVRKSYGITESFDATIRALDNTLRYGEDLLKMSQFQCTNKLKINENQGELHPPDTPKRIGTRTLPR